MGQEVAQPKTGLRKSVGVRMGRSKKRRRKKKGAEGKEKEDNSSS